MAISRYYPVGIVLLLTGLLLSLNLESTPRPWWDEGWTLTVARTWVEQGHYGLLLNGQPAPAGLQAGFPVTSVIALTFRLFGVGIWQARLVSVLFTVGTIGLLYYLASRLYNHTIALGTLFALLLMPMHPYTHPLIMGRQVLAEPPMLFYLLAGYATLLAALRKSSWFILLTIGFWGVAIITKAQPKPFWMLSLLLPCLLTLITAQWRAAILLAIALLGSLGLSEWLLWMTKLVLRGQTMPDDPVSGLYEAVAFVPTFKNLIISSTTILKFGLPTLLGLADATWQEATMLYRSRQKSSVVIVRQALLILAGSWWLWYLLLANGTIPRYLYPPTFFASIFVAALLYDLSNGFDLPSTILRANAALRHFTFNKQNISAWLAILLLALSVPFTLLVLGWTYTRENDSSLFQVADYLNTQTSPHALIESYDSELFFLLKRPYHYPPNQMHVELIAHTSEAALSMPLGYDPLAANPDFLVVGQFIRLWHLYDPLLRTDEFRLLHTFGSYNIYERVH